METQKLIDFKCGMCNGIFQKIDDVEALDELKRDFGDISTSDCIEVCDPCYQKVKPSWSK